MGNVGLIMFYKKKEILLGWVLAFGISVPSVWADIPREEIQPAHVYARAQRIQNAVELIRLELGKPKPSLLEIAISNAQPREVFFQALTLYQKSDRMCFDHTRNTGPIPPKMKEGHIIPADVYDVLTKAVSRVKCVSDQWQITEPVNEPPPDFNHTPSNVYMKILEVNRQLNFLLDIPYSPSTVFRRVQKTNDFVTLLIQRNSLDTKLPEFPKFKRYKRPREVYIQLQRCLIIMQRISLLTKTTFLDFTIKEIPNMVSPGDVFDLISLLFSEITHIGKSIDHESFNLIPEDISFPERKTPSLVFQNATHLENLLLLLESLLEESSRSDS